MTSVLTHRDVPAAEADELGREFAGYCRDLGGLEPGGRILDVGCGWGRLAFALASYLSAEGSYEGFDTWRAHVEWAQDHVAAKHRNFKFHVADIRNRNYNPEGRLRPTAFKFPYADASFDLVYARSLFTHMQPEELEHYAGQIARVVKPGGRILVTFFLLNDESLALAPHVPEPPYFRYPSGVVTTTEPDRGGVVAYREDYARGVFTQNGFELEPTYYGYWCGRQGDYASQDILVGTRSHERKGR